MASEDMLPSPNTGIAVRTLLVAGFTINGSHNQPWHVEIYCERQDVLGAIIPYLIAITGREKFEIEEIEDIRRTARRQNQSPVLIAADFGDDWISWEDFTEGLGGEVPTWKALGPTYENALLTASWNQLPEGEKGEAWLLFEDLVAVGLEFVFGRRVRRLGGRTRGRRVSDMQAQLPSQQVLVIDAKAAGKNFDAAPSQLRALQEYVELQKTRQRGQIPVVGALVVSSRFQQEEVNLLRTSAQFNAETGVPVTFMTAEQLAECIRMFRNAPLSRNGVKWNLLFQGGVFPVSDLKKELVAVHDERVPRGY